jgi:hypothetical protein
MHRILRRVPAGRELRTSKALVGYAALLALYAVEHRWIRQGHSTVDKSLEVAIDHSTSRFPP